MSLSQYLSRSNSCNYYHTITNIQLISFNYYHTITIIQLLSYNYNHTITVIQLLSYNYYHTITIIQLLSYNYYHTITTIQLLSSYPEWPHRQGGCWRLQGRFSVELRLHLFILCTRCTGGTAHEDGECDKLIGSTVSDASVQAGCGRLQLGFPHWASLVNYCK